MKMAGIRVNTGDKKIDVNDNGDYIVLDLSDSSFPDRFFSMVDRVQEHAAAAEARAKELEGRLEPGSEEMLRAAASLYRDLHEGVMAEVDALFGADTCRKVFGDIVPGIELFDDFFTQLMPYFEQFGKERAKRLSKYSAARTGNV